MIAFRYYVWFKKTTAKARVNRFNRTHNADWHKLVSCRDNILKVIKEL